MGSDPLELVDGRRAGSTDRWSWAEAGHPFKGHQWLGQGSRCVEWRGWLAKRSICLSRHSRQMRCSTAGSPRRLPAGRSSPRLHHAQTDIEEEVDPSADRCHGKWVRRRSIPQGGYVEPAGDRRPRTSGCDKSPGDFSLCGPRGGGFEQRAAAPAIGILARLTPGGLPWLVLFGPDPPYDAHPPSSIWLATATLHPS